MANRSIAPQEQSLMAKFFTNPLVAGANVVFGVVIGIVATIFHEDLKRSTPLLWLQDAGVAFTDLEANSIAISFWTVLLLFAGILTGQAWHNARIRKTEINRIETLISEAPPPEFYLLYDQLYQGLIELAKYPADDKARALRIAIDVVVQLAKRWDQPTSDASDTYRGNVMLRIAKEDWKSFHKKAAYRMYPKIEFGTVEQHANSGLWVSSTMATTGDPTPEVDNSVSALMLLVDESEKEDLENQTVNLRGAPEALRTERMQYVEDTTRMLVRDMGKSFSDPIRESIKKFYCDDEKAKSMISLPLFFESRAIGVLNIYRNSTHIMGSTARAENFSRIVVPFAQEIAKIASRL